MPITTLVLVINLLVVIRIQTCQEGLIQEIRFSIPTYQRSAKRGTFSPDILLGIPVSCSALQLQRSSSFGNL